MVILPVLTQPETRVITGSCPLLGLSGGVDDDEDEIRARFRLDENAIFTDEDNDKEDKDNPVDSSEDDDDDCRKPVVSLPVTDEDANDWELPAMKADDTRITSSIIDRIINQ